MKNSIYLAFWAVLLGCSPLVAQAARYQCGNSNSDLLSCSGTGSSFYIQIIVQVRPATRNFAGRYALVSKYSAQNDQRGFWFGLNRGSPAAIWSRDGTKATYLAHGRKLSGSQLRRRMALGIEFDKYSQVFNFYVNGRLQGSSSIPNSKLPIYGADVDEMIGCASQSSSYHDQIFPGNIYSVSGNGSNCDYDDGYYESGSDYSDGSDDSYGDDFSVTGSSGYCDQYYAGSNYCGGTSYNSGSYNNGSGTTGYYDGGSYDSRTSNYNNCNRATGFCSTNSSSGYYQNGSSYN